MGTDIHFYVERRDGAGWVSCDTWEPSEYEPNEITVPYGKHFYGERNYDLFAILANVRNGYGFAGSDTGDGFVPICEPRGLPNDLSPQLQKEVSSYLEHTPTWLTVREMMDYDWTRTATKRGWLTGPEFERWNRWDRGRGDGPRSWCAGVSGSGVHHVSEDEMKARIKAIDDLKLSPDDHAHAVKTRLGSTYCQVSWTIPYYKATSDFLSETLPRLWRLGAPEDVRCVFWFDS